MQPFEYLSVLVSIIVGIGLSHLLSTVARLIQERGRVHFFGPALLWMFILFLLHIQIWWAAFGWQASGVWGFFPFLLFLGLPIGAYLLSVLLVPDLDRAGEVNLKDSYFANRLWFFGVLGCLPLLSLIHEAVQGGMIQWDIDAGFRGVFLLLAVVGLTTRRERVHGGISILFAVLFGAYVFLLFRSLPTV